MSSAQHDDESRTSARLESLMAANRAIVAELSLATLLGLVTESAREVLGAQYAALAVVRPDGGIEQVSYSGVDEPTRAALRDLAQESGPLGHLLTRSESGAVGLRLIAENGPLTVTHEDEALVRSLLAVAVRTSTTFYGNLYLGNRVGASAFTAEDEDLVVALAATAGIAIENARLYEESHRRQQWLHASAEISQQLLAGADTATEALTRIAEVVQRLAEAETASVVVPAPGVPDELEVAVATGQGAAELAGMRYQVQDSVAWQAMQSGRGLVMADAHLRKGVYLHVRAVLPATQVMAIPLQGESAARGAIVLVRTGTVPFSEADREMAEGFANQATLAIELAEARQDRHRLAVLEDRARIARDLHDHVVQKLFAVGLTLQGAARTLPDPVLSDRLSATIGELDDTIRSIRGAIFQLQEPRSPRTSARSRVRSDPHRPDPDARLRAHRAVRGTAGHHAGRGARRRGGGGAPGRAVRHRRPGQREHRHRQPQHRRPRAQDHGHRRRAARPPGRAGLLRRAPAPGRAPRRPARRGAGGRQRGAPLDRAPLIGRQAAAEQPSSAQRGRAAPALRSARPRSGIARRPRGIRTPGPSRRRAGRWCRAPARRAPRSASPPTCRSCTVALAPPGSASTTPTGARRNFSRAISGSCFQTWRPWSSGSARGAAGLVPPRRTSSWWITYSSRLTWSAAQTIGDHRDGPATNRSTSAV